MDSLAADNIHELVKQAEAAFQRSDKKKAGILVNQILELDYKHAPAWVLIQKLMGNTQPMELFQVEFTKKFFPSKLDLLQKPAAQTALPEWLNAPYPASAPAPADKIVKPITQPAKPRPAATIPPQKPTGKRNTWLVALLLFAALILFVCLLANSSLLMLPTLRNYLIFYGYSNIVALTGMAVSVLGLIFVVGALTRKKWAIYALIVTLVLSPLVLGGLVLANYLGGKTANPDTKIVGVEPILPIVQDPGKIVFLSSRNSAQPAPSLMESLISSDICIMDADGSNQTCLTNTGNNYCPSVSPDGNKIAFLAFSSREVYEGDIYIMNLDGSGLFQLTNTGQVDCNYGSSKIWSPDSSKIVFRSWHEDDGGEIYTINIDGTGMTRLTNNNGSSETRGDMDASFSPDGKKILFLSRRDGDTECYTMNADGSEVNRLTNSRCFMPQWSPDGKKIAYWYDYIYVMNADGSNQTPIVKVSTGFEWYNWSPDGTKIIYQDVENEDDEINNIYVIGIDGGERVQLATGDYPIFSPNGQWIAYSPFSYTYDEGTETYTFPSDYHQISIRKSDGTNQTQLTSDGYNIMPIWIP